MRSFLSGILSKGNVTIQKASPILLIDATSGDGYIELQEAGDPRWRIFHQASTDKLLLFDMDAGTPWCSVEMGGAGVVDFRGTAPDDTEIVQISGKPIWHDGNLAARPTPALVSSLPGSPVNGQVCYYQNSTMATADVVWQLRYNSSESKWEFIGGSPLRHEVDTSESTSESAGWAVLATTGPTLAAPLAGSYWVKHGCQIITSATANAFGIQSISNNNGTPSFNDCISAQTPAAGSLVVTGATARLMTVATAGHTLACKYTTSGTSHSFLRRWLEILPKQVS